MCAFKLLFIWFSISYKTINILKQITLRFTNSKHFVLRIIDLILYLHLNHNIKMNDSYFLFYHKVIIGSNSN